MTSRVRRLTILAAALAAAAILVPAGGARRSAHNDVPTLYINYAMNCTFTIVDDNHQPVTSIAPGNYQIEVTTPIMFKLVVPGGPGVDNTAAGDFNGCKGWVQFQLTGPNVNVSTTLDTGCDSSLLLPPVTLKPNSTYTAQDLNQPAVAHASFTTLGAGAQPITPTSPYNPGKKGTTDGSVVGSDIILGTLTGILNSDGKPTLTNKGKAVSKLKAGRYKFAITDKDPKASFTIQTAEKPAKDLTTDKFVGQHSVTVTLTSGRWTYSSGVGNVSSFLVTS